MAIRVKSKEKTYEYNYSPVRSLLPKEVKKAFAARCKQEGTTESRVIRTAIQEFITGRPLVFKAQK